MVQRIGQVLTSLPECREETAWVGIRWRVREATVAHVFGGEDQLFRVTFRAEEDEVMALQHPGRSVLSGGMRDAMWSDFCSTTWEGRKTPGERADRR